MVTNASNKKGTTTSDDTAPESVNDVTRTFTTLELRDLGLPFRCIGGKVILDQSIHLAEDIDEERETRWVVFQLKGDVFGVPYSRPVDQPISARFDPWVPCEENVTATVYEDDGAGGFQQRMEYPVIAH